MTPLPPELEALMPEPEILLWQDHPSGAMPIRGYSADQVRQAMLDATERAAKKHKDVEKALLWCVTNLTEYGNHKMLSDPSNGVMHAIAAIRGGGQGS